MLGDRVGAIKSALYGVMAGVTSYAFVTCALAYALMPLRSIAAALPPWDMGALPLGLLAPVVDLAIESLSLLLFSD